MLRANEVVSTDYLIEALFGAEGPGSGANALQVAVSRLRRLLEADVIETRPHGYLLRVGPGRLDLAEFERLHDEGRRSLETGEVTAALASVREALALWRGPPLADLSELDAVQPEIRRLEELRLSAVIDRVDAELALGRGAELVPELQTLVVENPLRERLRGQLMLALYRSGRQADALAVYRDTRELLDDELGLEPSRDLQELERAILQHDPALDGLRLREPRRDAPVVVCPFKGLAPFVAADADYFFGRETLVGELVSRLASSTLVGVVGASGSGKSSLVQAGLLPELAAGALPGSGGWRTVVIRPGAHPLRELPADPGGERLVVAVDQLEEVFTVCTDESERAAFLERLAALAHDPARCTLVVVCLRVDFYGACAVYPTFAPLLSADHILVGPMDKHELARAIEGPAARAGLEVEPGLADALVGDVAGEPGALPLLSTSLLELWRLRDGRRLRLAAYREAGGVRGAVARLAESAYAQLSEEEQRVARRILLRLASLDETAAVRRRVPLDELDLDHDPTAARVVSVLTDARMLTASEGTLEVSHEALLTEWPRLRDWLAEDRDGRRLHAHLAAAAREWAARDRDPADLYRGARLAAALDWTTGHEPDLNQVEREFVGASRSESERELATRRRQVRRLRGLLVGAGLLLVLAVIAGAIALVSRSNAQQSATSAVAQRLGAQALLANDLPLSLLLAQQGVNLNKSPATLGNLEAALVHSPAAIRVVHPLPGGLDQRAVTSPDGRYLVVQGTAGTAILDAASMRTIRILHNIASATTFTTDGKLLVVYVAAGPNYGPGVVDPARGPVRNVYQPQKDEQHGAMSQDRRFYGWSATSHDRTILTEVSLVPPEKVLHRSLDGPGWPVQDIESQEGRLVVFRGANVFNGGPGKVEVWTLDPWRRETVVSSPVGFNNSGAAWDIDRQGRRIVLGHPDGSVTVTDFRTGRARSMNGRHGGQVLGVGFSPDGRTIVSTGDDAQVLVWDADTGQLREKLSGHFGDVYGPAGGLGGTVHFWNADTGAPAGRSLPGNPGWIRSLQFDPTGQLLLVAGQDGLPRIFDVTTRAPYGAPLPGYAGDDSEAFFSPDGGHVVTVYGDGRAIDWDIRPSSWEQKACAVAGRNLTRDEWTRHLGGRSYARTCPGLPPGT